MNILFFDIDGTLANGLEVPASAEKAIQQLRENGDNLVFICTGRPLNYVQKYFSAYADGFICFNGRYSFLKGQTFYDMPLTEEEISNITDVIDACQGGYIFYNNTSEFTGGYHGSYIPLDLQGESVYNFNVFFKDKAQFLQIEEALKDQIIFNPHGNMPHADATIAGSDKGIAITKTMEALHIPFENSYAFGDGSNDVSMFRSVAHAVAMGNALDILKKEAEYITDDIDRDGIKKALLHYGLIRE